MPASPHRLFCAAVLSLATNDHAPFGKRLIRSTLCCLHALLAHRSRAQGRGTGRAASGHLDRGRADGRMVRRSGACPRAPGSVAEPAACGTGGRSGCYCAGAKDTPRCRCGTRCCGTGCSRTRRCGTRCSGTREACARGCCGPRRRARAARTADDAARRRSCWKKT